MPVHLKALLTAVIVSPKAPIRFVKLVSEMVHRISHAMVARGSWPVAA
ncbi:hypothetical protein [Parapusillimonas granuli]|uniref:Uncharacterized protein n=1 Tax=Parapusillimonas granuli TaxID=380911 RepID=A0A853G4I1_9BURK|nr:hypothetical protein [Parapusillimonas granuli]MBB5217605.1 hypothetical protein [Parapusillimonas granuli]NYT49631.1 hypothetical protein [Parapusillimonas granuli]